MSLVRHYVAGLSHWRQGRCEPCSPTTLFMAGEAGSATEGNTCVSPARTGPATPTAVNADAPPSMKLNPTWCLRISEVATLYLIPSSSCRVPTPVVSICGRSPPIRLSFGSLPYFLSSVFVTPGSVLPRELLSRLSPAPHSPHAAKYTLLQKDHKPLERPRLRRVQPRAARCQAYSSFPLSFPERSTLLRARSPSSGTARARRHFPGSTCLGVAASPHLVTAELCRPAGLRTPGARGRPTGFRSARTLPRLPRYARDDMHHRIYHKRRDSAYSFAVFPDESAGPTASPDREESPKLGPGPVRPTAAAPLPQHRTFKFTPPQLSGDFRSCR
ncbi:hypothetical protein NDU88_001082 [Pleurodeles waltl]|uniref:Uncharacterized protein n=1 Tax=Pleurodeles waltl TaxID=8319 RepID=A0AAV7R7Z4_PLEWA|nr:hypothetical protein NDU88_001082 [Pleurodeles waltl]